MLLNIRKLVDYSINTNVVCILYNFVFHSPTVGTDSSTAFYRGSEMSHCWFSNVAVGIVNWLPLLKDYTSRAVFPATEQIILYRVTAATRMYHKGVDEQLICEKTGKSSKCVEM